MLSYEDMMISVAMGVCYPSVDIAYLQNAAQSILNQSHRNLELLVCQNGSSGEACQYLKELSENDSRVRLINGDNADTLAEKLNRCLKESHGNWIARMDDDDYSEPDRLQCQLEFIQSHEEFAFIGCNVRLVQDEKIIGTRMLPVLPVIKDFLFVQPYIHPALLFRKDALKAVGGYCEKKDCAGCEDYDLLLRMYERGYVGVNLQKPLLRYRIPARGESNRSFHLRINEVKTRYRRFKSLKLLPGALLFVIKPIIVGLIPTRILQSIKFIVMQKKWR